ncbi:MAG: RNA polymerase sigma-70 factor [Bacteroidales bacterium]|nr:RNA polymerase sigma-70 factor [Bacteroidales bacterium]
MVNAESNQLFQRIKADDRGAFELLFKRLYPRLKDFAWKVVKDEDIAKDIVQDVFIKLWEKKKSVETINIEAFIFKSVKNQCLTHLKHLKIVENVNSNLSNLSEVEELYRIDFVRNEPYVLIEKELQRQIEDVFNKLPGQCRNVFMLSRIEGLKNREIAEKLEINIKNVERHITRALCEFRKHFGDRLPLAVIILVLKELY